MSSAMRTSRYPKCDGIPSDTAKSRRLEGRPTVKDSESFACDPTNPPECVVQAKRRMGRITECVLLLRWSGCTPVIRVVSEYFGATSMHENLMIRSVAYDAGLHS